MSKIDKQINAHNKQLQGLRCCNTYKLNDFLSGGSGNYMITGGTKDRRRQILLRQIEYYRNYSNDPVVIFSDDGELMSQLIAGAESGTLGQLYVVNEKYNNYDFFKMLPINLTGEYFGKIALQRGARDTARLLTYTDAFLHVLSQDGSFNMRDMKAKLKKENSDISNFASQADWKNMLLGSTEGGTLLRDLMMATADAFAPLTTPDCSSGFNLTTCFNEDCVILVDIPKTNHELFAEYFAMVLRSAMDKSFVLLLDDEIMLNNKDFFDIIELLKQRYNIDVIMSYENIIAIQPDGTDILKNINRQTIFLNGNMPAVDLQHVLSRYGQYTAMESVEHREAPPSYLFTLLRGKGEAAATYTRDRAMLQNLNAEVVMSRGSNAEILAVRRLII